MHTDQPIKIETRTTRGVVLITLLLSLFAFSGVESRGPAPDSQAVKTELVARANRYDGRTILYVVTDHKRVFDFYTFHEIHFLKFQDVATKIRMASIARQSPEVEKFFFRYDQVCTSFSTEDDIIVPPVG